MSKPDRFAVGAIVRTLEHDGSNDWSIEVTATRDAMPLGAEGYVREISDDHGLCYLVDHIGHGRAWYNHAELELVAPGAADLEEEEEDEEDDSICPACKIGTLGEDGRCNGVECPSYEEIDTAYESNMICPWCGKQQGDTWEIRGAYEEDTIRMNCGSCERPFDSTCMVSYSFSTTRIDEVAEAIKQAEKKARDDTRLAQRYAECIAFEQGARVRVRTDAKYAHWLLNRVGAVKGIPSTHNPFVHVLLDGVPARDLKPYDMHFFPKDLERVDAESITAEEPTG